MSKRKSQILIAMSQELLKIVNIYLFLILNLTCPLYGTSESRSTYNQNSSKGYIVYVFAKRTEVMIDYNKSDGLSRGTKLDVFRLNVPNVNEPVKLGEIVVDKVGNKMSHAKVVAITSSLKMEKGDRVFPHPIVIVSDESWKSYRNPMDGWKSELLLPNEREWEKCLEISAIQGRPGITQLMEYTSAKPIWHPSSRSHLGDVFFRKVFQIDADIESAEIEILCGGRGVIYINGNWAGDIEDVKPDQKEIWNEPRRIPIKPFLRKGKNLIAIQVTRDNRTITQPILILAISIYTKLK